MGLSLYSRLYSIIVLSWEYCRWILPLNTGTSWCFSFCINLDLDFLVRHKLISSHYAIVIKCSLELQPLLCALDHLPLWMSGHKYHPIPDLHPDPGRFLHRPKPKKKKNKKVMCHSRYICPPHIVYQAFILCIKTRKVYTINL